MCADRMRRGLWLLGGWLMAAGAAEAACVSIPLDAIPLQARTAMAYAVATDAGHPEVPTDGQGLQPGQSQSTDICFNSFDPAGIVTVAALQARAEAEALRDESEQARQQTFTDEIATSDICDVNLDQINGRVNAWVNARQADVDGTTTAAQFKTVVRDQVIPQMGAFMQKLARCTRSRAR